MVHEGIYMHQCPSNFDCLMIKWNKFRNCKLLPNPNFIELLSKRALMIVISN